jgi:LPS-assembly lipoprotein
MTGLARRALLGLGAGAALSGCGFQPVYMPTASGNPGVAERELAAVRVGLIPERPGQLLRQALQQRLASDSGVPHRYDLQVTYWVSGEGLGVQPDNVATRIRLTGSAAWTLMAQDPAHTRLAGGSARAIDGFNVFNQQYFAADLENETVQRRLADRMADQIATQLAIWFRKRTPTVGAG